MGFYAGEAYRCINEEKWVQAVNFIRMYNMTLPDDKDIEEVEDENGVKTTVESNKYIVIESDRKYGETVKIDKRYTCPNKKCEQETEAELWTHGITKKGDSGLKCPDCKKVFTRDLLQEFAKIEPIDQPATFGIVPTEPKRGSQPEDEFNRKMVQWCMNYMYEISVAHVRFRRDYPEERRGEMGYGVDDSVTDEYEGENLV